MSSWHGHSAAEILLTDLHARKEKKKFLFPSSDVICLRRENNTSHHSYLGLIREGGKEGRRCLSEAQLGALAAESSPSLLHLETLLGQMLGSPNHSTLVSSSQCFPLPGRDDVQR